MNEDLELNCKSTPPTNSKVRNPFERTLINNLHKPLCSPGMYKIDNKKKNGTFHWDIDQACVLVPVEIVACNSQFEPSPDPALERIAEEATERFFSQEMVMPSPLESSKKCKPLLKSSVDASMRISSLVKETTIIMRDVSAQTVLTLPPHLPPELEKLLAPFCTFTQDQFLDNDYDNANVSLRRKLFFEEYIDEDAPHRDSEQTDDEVHVKNQPGTSFETHTPVVLDSEQMIHSQDLTARGVKRTFGTPLHKGMPSRPRNKILEVDEPCFSPIVYQTPERRCQVSVTSSLASISPVTKLTSSDEEKNTFTSPETEAMASCLECVSNVVNDKKGPCYCKCTPNKSLSLKRSTSLKESPPRSRKGSYSLSDKRSLSMSSLNRSRSVQKLDFSMDMSVDGSLHNHSQADSESSPTDKDPVWSLAEESCIESLVKAESIKALTKNIQSSTKIHSTINILDETPVKAKTKSNVLRHEISRIRSFASPLNMSLDTSMESADNPLNLEDKKIDFNQIDLKFLTENVNKFNYTSNAKTSDSSSSFKRIDSGFNDNTFYANGSSYYESAIKPSELTVTNASNMDQNNTAMKETSNVYWTRLDSGFKDDNSGDSLNLYSNNAIKKPMQSNFKFTEAKLVEKENVIRDNFNKFLVESSNKNEATMSMSDIFTDDMTFNCNFSSTPSKNKTRKALM